MRPCKAIMLLLLSFGVCCGPLPPKSKVRLVSEKLPPTFEFSGNYDLEWIWFRGPYSASPDAKPLVQQTDPSQPIWKISPPGSRWLALNRVPPIAYGQLPPGWVQEIPQDGLQNPRPWWFRVPKVLSYELKDDLRSQGLLK